MKAICIVADAKSLICLATPRSTYRELASQHPSAKFHYNHESGSGMPIDPDNVETAAMASAPPSTPTPGQRFARPGPPKFSNT